MRDSLELAKLISGQMTTETVATEQLASGDMRSIAEAHGVHGLLYAELSKTGRLTEDTGGLRQSTFHLAAIHRVQENELERVCAALSGSGVRYLLIKGAALCHQIYPAPELRPRVDTDILIEEASLPAVKAALADIGYESVIAHDGGLISYQTCMHYRDDCAVDHTIDIHWRITNRHEYRDLLRFDSMYESAVALYDFPLPVYAPNRVLALCVACIHLVGHHSDNPRLIWLYDMLLLVKQMSKAELDEFIELIRKNGVEDTVAAALTELGEHFHVEELARILAELGHADGVNLTGESRLELLESNLKSFETLSGKFRYLIAQGFPPVDYMLERYRPASRLLLPFCYIHRIAQGSFKTLSSGHRKK